MSSNQNQRTPSAPPARTGPAQNLAINSLTTRVAALENVGPLVPTTPRPLDVRTLVATKSTVPVAEVIPFDNGNTANLISPTPASLAGVAGGAILYSMPFQGKGFKLFLGFFASFNGNGGNQKLTYPTIFANAPLILHDDSGQCGTSVSALNLPNNNVAYNGWVIVIGF